MNNVHKKSIAIFVHYSNDGQPDANAMLYASELAKYFDYVVISSNINIPVPTVENDNIGSLKFDKNAYDFGYFYQALQETGACDYYDIVGFFNDSNYIINSLGDIVNWCFENEYDLTGITDCLGGRPELNELDQWHIQSHFMIFKNEVVFKLKTYFENIDFDKYFNPTISKQELRRQIIIDCEIMLSYVLRMSGIKIGAYFPAKKVVKDFKRDMPLNENTHIWAWKELIENKYPLIKRKIYDNSFPAVDRIWLNQNPYIFPIDSAKEAVKRYGNPDFTKTLK